MLSKVLIYATCAKGLLVFDAPDYPEVGPQVPGGTVETGETIAAAAAREFHEETGLVPDRSFSLLGTTDFQFSHGGVLHTHRRAFFHVVLPDDLPDGWHHHEETPFEGGGPILYRFFWMDRAGAADRLSFGMEAFLDRIRP